MQDMSTRTLVILRHAKADNPTGAADLDRPLTERGHADAGAAGAWIGARGLRPDLVLCSPAKRTRQTWHGVAVALPAGDAPTVRYEPVLYDDGTDALLALVQQVEPEYGTVLVVGHNPTVSNLSALLDPAANGDSDGLRTSGLAVHRFEGDWNELSPGGVSLVASHTARGD